MGLLVMGSRQVAVGWPPLRTYRINSLVNQAKSLPTEDGLSSNIQKDTATKNGVVAAAKNDEVGFIKSPMLVKVTMDGVIIGRKIDLNAFDSYEALAKTLEQMFFHTPPSLTTTSQFFIPFFFSFVVDRFMIDQIL